MVAMRSPGIELSIANDIDRARKILHRKKVLVLTGAGISTDSGIPDYRGAGRVERHPLSYDEFMGSETNRARYWARSYVGWHRMAQAEPNPGHHSLALAEQHGQIQHIITQNVDGLHQKAGATKVLELHGRLDRVLCTGCGEILSRAELDGRIHALNPAFETSSEIEFSPDGDAEIETPKNFRVPNCLGCGAHFKPDVVFFGEQVPKHRVALAEQELASAQALLVAGSSLTVNSGLRLVKLAHQRNLPIVIVNIGPTRADNIADAKLEGSTTTVLEAILD